MSPLQLRQAVLQVVGKTAWIKNLTADERTTGGAKDIVKAASFDLEDDRPGWRDPSYADFGGNAPTRRVATNHVGPLDRALFRRFDDIIEFALPDEKLAVAVMKARVVAIGAPRVDRKSVV